jgi:hypothetical protein
MLRKILVQNFQKAQYAHLNKNNSRVTHIKSLSKGRNSKIWNLKNNQLIQAPGKLKTISNKRRKWKLYIKLDLGSSNHINFIKKMKVTNIILVLQKIKK